MSSDAKDKRRQQFLEVLGRAEPQYNKWLDSLSEEKKRRVKLSTQQRAHGLYSVAPLQCHGPTQCPFITACPLVSTDTKGKLQIDDPEIFPYGLQCVLEKTYMAQQVADYMVYLDVDPANPIERAIVDELAVIDLLKNRALLIIAHGDSTGQGRDFIRIDQSITGVAEDGTILQSESSKLHPALEYVDKLERRREKWIDKLNESRKAKSEIDIKLGNVSGDSQILSDIQAMKKLLMEDLSIKQDKQREEELLIGIDDLMEEK